MSTGIHAGYGCTFTLPYMGVPGQGFMLINEQRECAANLRLIDIHERTHIPAIKSKFYAAKVGF